MRIRILTFFVIAMFTSLAVSLVGLVAVNGTAYKALSNKNCIRLIPQSGCRGRILDRNGSVIVESKVSYEVVILPQDAQELSATFYALARVLDVRPEELLQRFRKNYSEPSVPVTVATNIGLEKAVALEEDKFDLDGVVIQCNAVRAYPHAGLAAHVVGYLGEIDRWRLTKLADYGYKTKDIVGMGGIEEKYDYYLRQEDGGLSVEVDHRGRFSRVLAFRPPQSGKDIQLTLDVRLQRIVEDALLGNNGAAVVMDPRTGEVLAMASLPGYDPSIFVKRDSRLLREVLHDPGKPLFNRALRGQYPPGSIFKPVVACAGLETGKVTAKTSFHCPGSLQVGRRQFKCWDTHGPQSLVDAIAYSCDVYFYKTGLGVGPQQLHDFSLRFGLSRATGIELPYEEPGFIPNPLWKKISRFQKWYDGDTANFSIGQGDVLMTPLQACRMLAVFANNGMLVTPYLVRAIDNRDVWRAHQKVTPLHIRPAVLAQIKKGLRQVISDPRGTAHVLADAPVAVAGKTGTAQVSSGESHAWFVCFFPYEKPRYVMSVFLEHGSHGYSASLVARTIIGLMQQEGLL